MARVGAILLLSVLLGAVGARAGSDASVCVTCHPEKTALGLGSGGHAPTIDCVSCHADRRPGRVGQRHRAIVACRRCHDAHADAVGHPPRRRARVRETRNCVGCHEPHGSANAHLIQPAIRQQGRLAPITFTGAGGAVTGGFADPRRPGKGLCEVCHRTTRFYRADGKGEPHFTQDCTLCHFHPLAFQPAATGENCALCHAEEAARLAKPSLHNARFACTDCHATSAPTPGPGHETVPACGDCHASTATHAPPGVPPFPCTQCHDPHGTDNIRLVLDAIMTPQGSTRPIVFQSLSGHADGSFASVSAPGTGVCEICHTATRFYRADGTGESHFPYSCVACHVHGVGFEPP